MHPPMSRQRSPDGWASHSKKEQQRSNRLFSSSGDALALVKQSKVGDATALLQRALTGKPADAKPAQTAGSTDMPRRPLGDVMRALRAGRPALLRAKPAPAAPRALQPGETFAPRQYAGEAGSIGYWLHVPQGHARQDLALVMMLHGCTQDPQDFAAGTRMNQLGDEFGLVVAYPQQTRGANPNGCWNWFLARNQKRGAGEPAVLAGLAQALAAEFGIAPGRVFVAGLSAGGAMADILASEYPDVFAAAGIHSGLPHGAARDVPSAFAAMNGSAGFAATRAERPSSRKIIFHGSGDTTVHPVNGERVLATLRGTGAEITCDREAGGRKVVHTVLQDQSGRAMAEHWLIQGAGHAWSGGDPAGSYTQADGPDASRLMVKFFLAT